jgi:hypothetical protein
MTKAKEVDSLALTSQQLKKALISSFKIKRPVFVWGPPGIGKSEVVKSVTHSLGGHVIDLRMSQLEPTDLRGIPFFNKDLGKMDWAPPIDLPDEELASKYPIVVLFLDEMNGAAPSLQAAGYQLVLDRRVGKYVLPDNVVIVAAGNRESDRGVTYRMPTPLANRFIHVEMRTDFDSWQDWAINKRVHKDVVGYINFAKNDLYDFDSKSSSRAFATPRSWTYVSDILAHEIGDSDTEFNLIAGAIGEGLAVKFTAHRKVAGKMPNPTEILSGKVKTLKTKEISAMYSLTVSMVYELKEMTTKVSKQELTEMFDNFLYFMMKNFETEIVVMGARLALKTYRIDVDESKLEHYDEFAERFSQYI